MFACVRWYHHFRIWSKQSIVRNRQPVAILWNNMAAPVLAFIGVLMAMGFSWLCAVMQDTVTMTILILLVASTWLCMKSGSFSQPAVSHAAVQCDFFPSDTETHFRPQADTIYAAPNSVRWHFTKSCRRLKAATKPLEMTPCQTCSAAEHTRGERR